MNLFYKISIDQVNTNYISGWCFHRLDKMRPVDLECLCDGRVLRGITVPIVREDLRELGFHPTGDCGFEIIIDENEHIEPNAVFALRVKGTKQIVEKLSVSSGGKIGLSGVIEAIRELINSLIRSRKTIIFMHIPKTAGTTFNTEVRYLLGGRKVLSHIELQDKAGYRLQQRRHDYLSGHMRLGIIVDNFDLHRAECYTIIREPYAQLHSHIKWLIQTSTHGRDQFIRYNNPIIYDLGRRLAQIDLSNADSIARFIADCGEIEASFLDNMQTRYFLFSEPSRVSREDLEQACVNTTFFRLIGSTEAYGTFVTEFACLHGLKQPKIDRKLNRSESPALFDVSEPETRRALLPLVCFDLQLYQFINHDKN